MIRLAYGSVVNRESIGLISNSEALRTIKGGAKRKPGYKFIRGACLVGVGSDAARAANLFRRGKRALRPRQDEAAATIKSFHYLNWVLLVGTCNQFFSPPLAAPLPPLPRISPVTPSRSSPEMNKPRMETEARVVERLFNSCTRTYYE